MPPAGPEEGRGQEQPRRPDAAATTAKDEDDRAVPLSSLPNRLTMADPETAAATLSPMA